MPLAHRSMVACKLVVSSHVNSILFSLVADEILVTYKGLLNMFLSPAGRGRRGSKHGNGQRDVTPRSPLQHQQWCRLHGPELPAHRHWPWTLHPSHESNPRLAIQWSHDQSHGERTPGQAEWSLWDRSDTGLLNCFCNMFVVMSRDVSS